MVSPGPIRAAEALAAGTLTQHQLRSRYRRLFAGVYLHRTIEPTLALRTEAAWLWSKRGATVGGLAAAALHGAKWVDVSETIDVFSANTNPPTGIRCRNDTLLDDEVCVVRGLPATTVARTGFDLGRRFPVDAAVARLDALLNATGTKPADIAAVAERHPHSRGLRRLDTALARVDPGAESPPETRLRLLLVPVSPPVQTQIEVRDEWGRFVARLDMGWPQLKVAVEYDGEQHRTDRRQYIRDVRRTEALARLGWIVIRVAKEDRPADVVRRVCEAIERRCRGVEE